MVVTLTLLAQRVRDLRHRAEQLEAALREWGCHKYGCHIDEEGSCDCGWEEVLEALATGDRPS